MSWQDNISSERPTITTHLECSMQHESYEAEKIHGLSRPGEPLRLRYDLEGSTEECIRADEEAV